MLSPIQRAVQAARVQALEARTAERQQWAAAGISWPPVPYQRVEVTGNRLPKDPPGRLLGTVLIRDGSNTLVLLDCYGEPRLCYWDNELRPVPDDPHPGWVPYDLWKGYIAPTADRTMNYDIKTNVGSGCWAFGCFAKPQVTGDYQFQQIGKPYTCCPPRLVAGIRPSNY